jgi:hypothetical protein
MSSLIFERNNVTKTRKVKVISAIVAEDIRQEKSGQQTIIGAFGGMIGATDSQLVLPRLIIRLEFTSEEDFDGRGTVSLVSPTGAKVFTNPEPLQIKVKKDRHNIVAMGWGPVLLKESGVYQIKFTPDVGIKETKVAEVLISLGQTPEAMQAVNAS